MRVYRLTSIGDASRRSFVSCVGLVALALHIRELAVPHTAILDIHARCVHGKQRLRAGSLDKVAERIEMGVRMKEGHSGGSSVA